MFWTHLNPLESPKPPRKSKKVIFRELKIGAGVLKVALKYFLLVLGPKIFRRPLPYLHAGKVSDLGHPLTPPIRIKCEKPQGGGHNVPPPLVIGLKDFHWQAILKIFVQPNLLPLNVTGFTDKRTRSSLKITVDAVCINVKIEEP